MKKAIASLLGVSLLFSLSACNQSSKQTDGQDCMSLDASKWQQIVISDQTNQQPSLKPGRYLLENEDDASENQAVFTIYISDEQYDSMSSDLEMDLVQALDPGQSVECSLQNGNYLYVAATDMESGVYKEGLNGSLIIQAGN